MYASNRFFIHSWLWPWCLFSSVKPQYILISFMHSRIQYCFVTNIDSDLDFCWTLFGHYWVILYAFTCSISCCNICILAFNIALQPKYSRIQYRVVTNVDYFHDLCFHAKLRSSKKAPINQPQLPLFLEALILTKLAFDKGHHNFKEISLKLLSNLIRSETMLLTQIFI